MTKVVIYTKRTCPYCIRAKALLEQKQVAYQEIGIDEDPDLREAMIQRSHGRTTVPQIFINDQHIGGCDDLFELEAAGQLDSLLQKS